LPTPTTKPPGARQSPALAVASFGAAVRRKQLREVVGERRVAGVEPSLDAPETVGEVRLVALDRVGQHLVARGMFKAQKSGFLINRGNRGGPRSRAVRNRRRVTHLWPPGGHDR